MVWTQCIWTFSQWPTPNHEDCWNTWETLLIMNALTIYKCARSVACERMLNKRKRKRERDCISLSPFCAWSCFTELKHMISKSHRIASRRIGCGSIFMVFSCPCLTLCLLSSLFIIFCVIYFSIWHRSVCAARFFLLAVLSHSFQRLFTVWIIIFVYFFLHRRFPLCTVPLESDMFLVFWVCLCASLAIWSTLRVHVTCDRMAILINMHSNTALALFFSVLISRSKMLVNNLVFHSTRTM